MKKSSVHSMNKKLGPVAMARFLQQFEAGKGNYTEERHQWLSGSDIEEVFKKIEKMRTSR